MRLLTFLFLIFALSACGTRGALQLPPGPAPEPLFGKRPAASTGTPKPADTANQQKNPQEQQPDHSNNPASQ
jgi:predicted small lipoprotein YifL